MSDQPRSYRRSLQDQAASGVILPLHRDSGDSVRVLRDTILLILGPDRGQSAPYRQWASQLGGMGLYIEGEFGLIDWLERNTFVRSIVLIDDPRLPPRLAADIAAEVRVLRPDVPVILALDEGDDDEAEAFEPDAGWPSFAVEHRPFALTSFLKAIEVARLMSVFDRDNQPRHIPHLTGEAVTPINGSEAFDDHMGSHVGWWIIPAVMAGLVLWITLLAILIPNIFATIGPG
jgi:hypothetical protein